MKRIERKKKSGIKNIGLICACNWERSFPGVEHEPKKIERGNLRT